MFVRNYFMALGAVLLTVGGTLTAAPQVLAIAPQEQTAASSGDAKGAVEATTASLVADIHLPGGAVRATAAGDMANFNKALQEAAKNNDGRITSSEVLIWTGDEAKSVISDISGALKQSGYMVAEVSPFDSEAGRITPLAAQRGSKSDRIIGLWIETKTGEKLLVWGKLVEDAAPLKTVAQAAKPNIAAKKSVAAANRAEEERKERVKSVTAAKARLEKSSKSSTAARSGSTETAAQRQAKAMKAYQDYQWVKYNAPISGSMYRSSKW